MKEQRYSIPGSPCGRRQKARTVHIDQGGARTYSKVRDLLGHLRELAGKATPVGEVLAPACIRTARQRGGVGAQRARYFEKRAFLWRGHHCCPASRNDGGKKIEKTQLTAVQISELIEK
jgi:hypothetical protein